MANALAGYGGPDPLGDLEAHVRLDAPQGHRPVAGDVPDERAVGDHGQPVAADVVEDVLGPPQRSPGHEHHGHVALVQLGKHLLGVRRHGVVRADERPVEVGGDQPRGAHPVLTSDNVTVTGSPSSMPTARLTACLTGST